MQKKQSPQIIEGSEEKVVKETAPCQKCGIDGVSMEKLSKIDNFKDVKIH